MSGKQKGSVKQAFASKSFKSGGYSLAMCAVVVVIAVLVNLIVGALPSKIAEPDMSEGGLFTLSDYSKQVVKGLKTDVTIYQLATESTKDPYVARLLDRYADASDKIKVELRDPEVSQIATQYTKDEVSANTLIFVSEKRSKVVQSSSLYSYSENAMNAYYSGGQSNPDEFCGEREITSALSFVTTDVLPKIYALTGHGEYTVSDTLTSAIATENIELDTLDLMTAKTIPEDCACLLTLAPTTDLTAKEQETILAYLDGGGRLLAATMTTNNLKAPTPNYEKLLLDCGIKTGDGFLIEGDGNMFYYSPTYLMPNTESHEITAPLSENNYHVCMPVCQNLSIDPNVRSELTVTPILRTSDDAFARTNVENDSAEKAENDLDGPFDVGFAVTKGEGEKEMRAVVLATPYFLEDQFSGFAGNVNLLLNSLKWMCDLEENIAAVEVKSLSFGGTLEVTDNAGLMGTLVLTVILPVTFLVVGIVIYVRRKKR